MINKVLAIVSNRNSILVLALILGLTAGDLAHNIKDSTVYLLAFVMMFASTGIKLSSLFPLRNTFKVMASATALNYLVGSTFTILLSFLLIKDMSLFYGMVVIGASPPGIAVIPFSHILKGDINYSIIGTLGSYLAAVIIAPLIILLLTTGFLQPAPVFVMMIKIIVIPIILSRLLRFRKIYPIIEKVKGRIIDIGFAFIIFIAIGLNRDAFFSEPKILLAISTILILSTFGLGMIYSVIAKRFSTNKKKDISRKLFLTVKSSGFTAATSLAMFGERAAIPSAVLSIVVLIYLLFLSFTSGIKQNL